MQRNHLTAKSPGLNRRRAAFGIGALFLGTALLAGCAGIPAGATVEPPQVTLADIRPIGAGLLEQRYEAVLRLRNPNAFDVPLSGLRYTLDLNGQPFGGGSTNDRVTLPRLGETTIAVESATNIVQLLAQLNALRAGGLTYDLRGDAFLSGGGDRSVPFEAGGRLFGDAG